jgi:hypothetical protein
MPRRKAPPALTPQQVVQFVDAQSFDWQSEVLAGFINNPDSSLGKRLRGMLMLLKERGDSYADVAEHYEQLAKLTMRQIDPQNVLGLSESLRDKEIAQLTGYANADSVKTARAKMKKKVAKRVEVPAISHHDCR